MTDSGGDGDFQPHPGDPWHPAWSSEQGEADVEFEGFQPYEDSDSTAEAAEPEPPRKRRWFGRGGDDDEQQELSGEDGEAAEDDSFPDGDGIPLADVATSETVEEVRAPSLPDSYEYLDQEEVEPTEETGEPGTPEEVAEPLDQISDDSGDGEFPPLPLRTFPAYDDEARDAPTTEVDEVAEDGFGDRFAAPVEEYGETSPDPAPLENLDAGPAPAWMTDKPTEALEAPSIPVAAPSWAGDSTEGADDVSASLSDHYAPPEVEETTPEADDGDEVVVADDAPDEEPVEPVVVAEAPQAEEPEQEELDEDDEEAAALAALAALTGDDPIDDVAVEIAGEETDEETQEVEPVDLAPAALEDTTEVEPEDLEEETVGVEPLDLAPAALVDITEIADEGDTAAEASDEAGIDAIAPEDEPDEPAVAAAPPEGPDYGVAGVEAYEELRDLAGDEQTLEQGYGVAGVEAFDELLQGDAEEEVERWQDYAEPDAEADAEDAEPSKRRWFWPFGRRKDQEPDEVVAEQDGEWVEEGAPVPDAWFAEVDEDEVVPPSAELPETEWPDEVDPFQAADLIAAEVADAGPEAEVEPDAEVEPAAIEEDQGVEELTDHEPEAEDDDETDEYGWGTPVDYEAAPGPLPAGYHEEEDDEEVLPEEPITLSFDDGSGDRAGVSADFARPDAAEEPEDEWVTGPVDLDDDLTIEIDELQESSDQEDAYAASGTIEHRDLAEEIFRRGEEETQWTPLSAAMPGVETGVVGFDDVADLGDGESEYREPEKSNLGVRVLTGVILIALLLGSLLVSGEAFAIFIGLMALIGMGEFFATLRRVGFRPMVLFGYLGAVALLGAVWFHGPVAIPTAVGLTAAVILFVYAFAPLRDDALANAGLTLVGVAWVVGAIAFAIPMLHGDDFRPLVLGIVAGTVAMDVGAYSFGRAWGRRALAPVLSPNKSVEGLAGGLMLGIGACVAFGAFVDPFDLRSGALLGLIVAIAAPLGDLAESMVKRSLGVKDMGTILPGHGGILDRIDAFLYVIPCAWVLYEAAGLLG